MIKKIGKHTYGTEHIKCLSWGEENNVYIGSFCSIANNITILLGGNHRTDWITTYPFGHVNKNIFKNFSGNGVVIARNSHVVKNIEPYSIYGGNPAKLIKYRFTSEQIKKLQEIKWWEWDDKKIDENTKLLCSSNIDDFINLHLQ